MADFCRQCSEELFGKDFEDFKGATTAEDWSRNEAAVVLCEGCGPIQVDPDGSCISADCTLKGHTSPEEHPFLR